MDESIHTARYFEREGEDRVHCTLCPHECRIAEGFKGACGVRVNRGGTLYTLVYDKVVARHAEPIEKKPFFHFLPGSIAYSIGTVGCNLRCSFCQNWEISQWPKSGLPRKLDWTTDDDPEVGCAELAALGERVPAEPATPDEIVRAALRAGARSIAYTYTEPTIFFELAVDTARMARQEGLRNVLVTNGYTCEAPQRELAEVTDAANVDLKFFRERSYRRVARGRLSPVLDAIRRYLELGVWLEVTTLLVPGLNDSDEELGEIAGFLRDLDPKIPWHVSQFHPVWRMRDRSATPVESIDRARKIGREAGLRYVYAGNVPGSGGESTRCPGCGLVLVERHGLTLLANRIAGSRCPDCGERIDGVLGDPLSMQDQESG